MPKIHIMRSLGAVTELTKNDTLDRPEAAFGQLIASQYPQNVYGQSSDPNMVVTDIDSVKRGKE